MDGGTRQEEYSRESIQGQQKEVGLDTYVWCPVQETYTPPQHQEWARLQTRTALTRLPVAAIEECWQGLTP